MRVLLCIIALLPIAASADQIIRQSGSDWVVEDVKPGGFFAGVAAARKAQEEQELNESKIRLIEMHRQVLQQRYEQQQLSPSDWEKLERTKEFLKGTPFVTE